MGKSIDILDLSLDELKYELEKMGIKSYRGEQIYEWLYKGVVDFKDMTNISKDMQEILSKNFNIKNIDTLEKIESEDGSTVKYLSLLEDGNIIESVVMRYSYGNTICVSTQIGCRMGCSFCASCKKGFVRNLSPGEMVAQVLAAERHIESREDERAIKNVVLMGSGEPLDNYKNTIKFLEMIHDPLAINISYRNITLSTCGVVDKIYALAEEGLPITLAISLHAPNDDIRKKIMPSAYKYSIDDIIDASEYYFEKTGRRVTLEYALIDGVNDKSKHAVELAKRLKGLPFHVNIIPINEIRDSHYRRSSERTIRTFINTLEKYHIPVSRRRELGHNIQGACGQLRHDYLDQYISHSKGE